RSRPSRGAYPVLRANIWRTPVTPYRVNSGSMAGSTTWACMSHSPGIRYLPRPSITAAPAGTGVVVAGPTAAIRSPRTPAVELGRAVPAATSMTVTGVIATYSPAGSEEVGDWAEGSVMSGGVGVRHAVGTSEQQASKTTRATAVPAVVKRRSMAGLSVGDCGSSTPPPVHPRRRPLPSRAAAPARARGFFPPPARPLGGAGSLGQPRSLPRPEVSWSRDSKAHGAVPALTPHTTRTDHRRHRRGTPGDPLNRPPLAVTIPVAVPAGVGRRRDSAGPEGRCARLTEEQAWALVGPG